MARKRGRYYLARISKMGCLDDEKIRDAILDASPMEGSKFGWTFTGGTVIKFGDDQTAIGAHLTKYKPKGVVDVLDATKTKTIEEPEDDLVVAKSPLCNCLITRDSLFAISGTI